MDIRQDNLSGEAVIALLQEHLDDMHATTPAESVHALDLDGLRRPEITFWTIWEGEMLAGCCALKALEAGHGEIKSMRTARAYRRRGVGALLMEHLLAEARRRGYQKLSLETGSPDFFAPARRLYARFGFTSCEPFADYVLDPHSVYLSRTL
ncbi:GNAT family N-acetyltransferase [Uliginosibacterium gangwonense]|uniref:GNAT family N-acetyltransferase n=1 Tax=Uliginosibacterium gangwonense TaxID=392736 RepID=UPI000374E9B6|nr:GNAT family N-acetyltransferase [Uliginosibacterium gangwonense]